MTTEVKYQGNKLSPEALLFLLGEMARRKKYVVLDIDGKSYEVVAVEHKERNG